MAAAPRFLFIIADSWGPLGCTVPVARELEARGAEVAFSVFDFHGFLNKSNELVPPVDAEGILRGEGFRVLDSSVPPLDLPGKVPMPKNFLLEYPKFQSLFRNYLIPYYEHWTRSMLPRLREYAPAAVWMKDQVLAAAMTGEALGVPWATFSVFTGLIESDDSLPWTMGFSPPRSAMGRTAHRFVKWGMRRFRMTLDDAFNASRARLGLPPLEDALRTTAISPHLYTIFVAPELEPERASWPPQVRFVGPYSWDVRRGYQPPDWFAKLPTDKPFIYSTIGTTSNRMEMDVLAKVMQALGDEPVTVAISTGDDYVKERLPPAPPNFHIESFLPNTLVVPRAQAMVIHGGVGTVMQGFVHGVPMVVMPGNLEHFDCAQRIVERGCGIRIDKKKVTADKIRAAVRRLLGEPAFREASQRVKAQLAHYDSTRACADALLELAVKGQVAGVPAAAGAA